MDPKIRCGERKFLKIFSEVLVIGVTKHNRDTEPVDVGMGFLEFVGIEEADDTTEDFGSHADALNKFSVELAR